MVFRITRHEQDLNKRIRDEKGKKENMLKQKGPHLTLCRPLPLLLLLLLLLSLVFCGRRLSLCRRCLCIAAAAAAVPQPPAPGALIGEERSEHSPPYLRRPVPVSVARQKGCLGATSR